MDILKGVNTEDESFFEYVRREIINSVRKRFHVSGLPRGAGAEIFSLLYGFTLFPCVRFTVRQPSGNRFIPDRTGA